MPVRYSHDQKAHSLYFIPSTRGLRFHRFLIKSSEMPVRDPGQLLRVQNSVLLTMPVRYSHDQKAHSLYFITFTCYRWLHLFEIAGAYDAVYKWFDYLHTQGIYVTGYVIMPNHVHVLLYFNEMNQPLNTTIGNAKRFMAYAIIQQLETAGNTRLLEELHGRVKKREQKKGQRHKVFEESFDAKECYSEAFLYQKLDYIHANPVRKKWNLVQDYTEYEHSSASFYVTGKKRYEKIRHINEILETNPGVSQQVTLG